VRNLIRPSLSSRRSALLRRRYHRAGRRVNPPDRRAGTRDDPGLRLPVAGARAIGDQRSGWRRHLLDHASAEREDPHG
jgi:hypothetical protein